MESGADRSADRPASEAAMRDYLLGRLDERDRERLEDEYFSSDDAFEHLEALEDQLIDDYLSGILPKSDRTQFEHHFLRSEQRQRRLHFAGTLRACAAGRTDHSALAPAALPRRIWLKPLTWSLAGACALAAVWLSVDLLSSRLGNERAQPQAADQRHGNSVLGVHPDEAQNTVARLSLRPELQRGRAAEQSVRLSPDAQSVQFTLFLPGPAEFADYRASVRVVESDEPVWAQAMLKATRSPDGDRVVCTVPASVLSDQVFVLELSGVKGLGFVPIASYIFTAIEN